MRYQLVYTIKGQPGTYVKYFAHKPNTDEILVVFEKERNEIKSAVLYKEDSRQGWVEVRKLV